MTAKARFHHLVGIRLSDDRCAYNANPTLDDMYTHVDTQLDDTYTHIDTSLDDTYTHIDTRLCNDTSSAYLGGGRVAGGPQIKN